MSWRDHVRADPLSCLLGEDTPAVRAATLQRLLDRPADAPKVQVARACDDAGGPHRRHGDLERRCPW